MCSCAGAARAPEAGGPRAGESPYPVLMTDDPDRRENALTAWTALTREQGITNAPAPELQPVTATLSSIPTLSPALYLPKVGTEPTMNEEETREALRRFVTAQSRLLGADPVQLSLVRRTDQADGNQKAEYEQRPFRFPLRNGYGKLEITFAPDRRILQISSTCIPDAEKLQRAAAAASVRMPTTTDEAIRRMTGRTFTYTDATGNAQTVTVAAGEEINVRSLVVYPRPRTSQPPALEFHLAWEITLGGTPARTIYLDTVTDEVLGGS